MTERATQARPVAFSGTSLLHSVATGDLPMGSGVGQASAPTV